MACAALLTVASIFSIVSNVRFQREWDRTAKALKSLPRKRVDAAVQAYVRAQKTRSRLRPATVTLNELVSDGYLRANELSAFGGKEVEVFIQVVDFTPKAGLIRVHLTSSRDIFEAADGSVILVPKL